MKNGISKQTLEIAERAYNLPLSKLCEEIKETRGEPKCIILFSVLQERLSLNEYDKTNKARAKKKEIRKIRYMKNRRNNYD